MDKVFHASATLSGRVIRGFALRNYGDIMPGTPVLAYVMFKVSSGTEREVAQKLIDFKEVMQADVVLANTMSSQKC